MGIMLGFEYVDLGLSVKWATCNIGASKPEDYGDYFAWGETETKNCYHHRNYKWRDSCELIKYNNDIDHGTVDNKFTLDREDDVAHVKWGGNWRMATIDEWGELIVNCTWKWYDKDNLEFNGVPGYKVTSKKDGYTDRFIFLPAAGDRYSMYIDEPSRPSDINENGFYWTSSLIDDDSSKAYFISFHQMYACDSDRAREFGHSVRPVCP